jgi:hypothetical protein
MGEGLGEEKIPSLAFRPEQPNLNTRTQVSIDSDVFFPDCVADE